MENLNCLFSNSIVEITYYYTYIYSTFMIKYKISYYHNSVKWYGINNHYVVSCNTN